MNPFYKIKNKHLIIYLLLHVGYMFVQVSCNGKPCFFLTNNVFEMSRRTNSGNQLSCCYKAFLAIDLNCS